MKIKNGLRMLIAILALSAGTSFAERCDFPKTYTVVAPAGTHITYLTVDQMSHLLPLLTSETTFSVYPQGNCFDDAGWYNNIEVGVTLDDTHAAKIKFIDRDKNIRVFETSSTNGFQLDSIDTSDHYNPKLIFKLK